MTTDRGSTTTTSPGDPLRFDPLAPAQLADPYSVYARLREEEPVHFAPQFDLWVVSRHEDVVAVAKDHATFSSRDAVRTSVSAPPPEVRAELAKGLPDAPTLTDSDEPVHRRLRALVRTAFTHARVRALEPGVAAAALALVEGFAADGRADVIERFGFPLPLAALADMLGFPPDDIPRLHEWSYGWLRLIQATDPVEQQVIHARGFVALQHYVMRALEERVDEPRDDLLSALLAARLDGAEPLTMVEAMRVPLNLIIAGHVTVTRAIGNSLEFLLRHPDVLDALRRDPSRWTTAIEELLRLESPAQGLFRTTTREVTLGGATIPPGARVMVLYGSANRDPAVFERAPELDLEREDVTRHVAFGKGIHVCIGAPLARLELRIGLPLLVDALRNLRLDPARSPVRDTIFFARGFRELWVEWDPG